MLLLFDYHVLDPPSFGLYFTWNGRIHLPGDTIVISDIGPQPADLNHAGSTIVCVTTNVNTACCRDVDNPNNFPLGGAVGDWYYPDGTTIPHANNDTERNFARFDFRHQLRLARTTSGPVTLGEYRCAIPTITTGVIINAIITIHNGNLTEN